MHQIIVVMTLIIKLIFFWLYIYFRLCSKTKPLNVSYGIGQLLCFRCCSTVRLKLILYLSCTGIFIFYTEISTFYYCQSQKTVNTWKISGMSIVYWPITIKFRTHEQTSRPQTNYGCCLRFSYLVPYWLISGNTLTFHKYYFWCSRFCEFHSNADFIEKNYSEHNRTVFICSFLNLKK